MKKPLIAITLLLLGGCQTAQQALNHTMDFTRDLVAEPPAEPNLQPQPSLTPAAVVRPAPAEPEAPTEVNLAADLPPNPTDQPLAAVVVMDQPYAEESTNWGVPPVSSLLPGDYKGATPTTLGGGTIITTYQLHQFLKKGAPVLLINTLAGDVTEAIPGSVWLSGAGSNGTFNDAAQTQMEQRLTVLTGGNRDRALVFYCLDAKCWYAYNAAMRAIMMRYNNVYWYRGGLRAWNAAGLPHVPLREDRWNPTPATASMVTDPS